MTSRQRISSREPMEEKRELRRQPDNHHFGSLLMLAVRIGAFLLVTWEPRRLYVSSSKRLRCLESGLAKACPCCGYLELGMFDEAAQVLEEIHPEDHGDWTAPPHL